MTETEQMYVAFIFENLDNVEVIQKDIEQWEVIYKKRVFDKKWPQHIQEIVDLLRTEIKQELEQCRYYVKRIKEVRNEQFSTPQPGQDQSNASAEGAGAGDTDKDAPIAEPEDLGFTPEEINDNWGENQ